MRKSSTTEQHKFDITDHVAQENHLIDWEETKIIDRDSNPFSKKSKVDYSNTKTGGGRHSTAMTVCTLSITYIIHCCLELNFLGMMLPLQELTSARKVAENICDQDLGARGQKLTLSVHPIGFV